MSWRSHPWVDAALMMVHQTRYQTKLRLQCWQSQRVSVAHPVTQREEWPGLTLFISSYNTRYPLELTLRTLLLHADYPNLKLIVGENNSQDGSREWLREFVRTEPRLEVWERDRGQPHGLWLDEIKQLAITPYWAAVDSDLLFFPRDFFRAAVAELETKPDCWLLQADARPGGAYPEDPETTCPEALGTWLFFVRTGLRDRIDATFLGQPSVEKLPNGKPRYLYECGALVLQAMRAQGLRYETMSKALRCRFYHFGNLSWAGGLADQSNRFTKMKQYQIRDIKRRLEQHGKIP